MSDMLITYSSRLEKTLRKNIKTILHDDDVTIDHTFFDRNDIGNFLNEYFVDIANSRFWNICSMGSG